MASGTLIAESLRPDCDFEGLGMTVSSIDRVTVAELSAAQRASAFPKRWTLVRFEISDLQAESLAGRLVAALDGVGWFASIRTAHARVVVFASGIVRCDIDGRRLDVEAAARANGVLPHQIDWP